MARTGAKVRAQWAKFLPEASKTRMMKPPPVWYAYACIMSNGETVSAFIRTTSWQKDIRNIIAYTEEAYSPLQVKRIQRQEVESWRSVLKG